MKFAIMALVGFALCTASLYCPSCHFATNGSALQNSSNLYACPRCRKAKPKGPKKLPSVQKDQHCAVC